MNNLESGRVSPIQSLLLTEEIEIGFINSDQSFSVLHRRLPPSRADASDCRS
jgi:hypothetical protein